MPDGWGERAGDGAEGGVSMLRCVLVECRPRARVLQRDTEIAAEGWGESGSRGGVRVERISVCAVDTQLRLC